ncbi:superoxide dismutase family protein [Kutzneria sp. CA-103260]|uniref:superoxide dismutase family protein n=1 Tax=Kutzneria sp. CA-103260 TaxID=2802641 RepID=UPI001BEF28F9|nr:superoxide dismutase family protein [Kutzneria sp. CA-103260]QUQ65457.1 Copper/zinc superoxide dismutase (SODC) [Kutzneria sp. CA-103260]
MGHKPAAMLLTMTAAMLSIVGTATADPTPPAHTAYTSADFENYRPDAKAVTYSPDLVPVGSTATVAATPSPNGTTTVVLYVEGLLANHQYGAHVHQRSCGRTPEDAGPHYQNTPDPVQPSVNPAYANPQNEIWLDFTTDRHGNAWSISSVNWQFTQRHAGSVVIHTEHTHTDPGSAGTAGARLACVTVDF